jgi:hypothetical protein
VNTVQRSFRKEIFEIFSKPCRESVHHDRRVKGVAKKLSELGKGLDRNLPATGPVLRTIISFEGGYRMTPPNLIKLDWFMK